MKAGLITSTDIHSLPFRFSALLVLTIAAIGPLTQQILGLESYPLVTATKAFLPIQTMLNTVPHRYALLASFFTGASNFKNTVFDNAIYAGMYATSSKALTVSSQCTSGNCTWTNYTTFVVRSQITKAKDQLRFASIDLIKVWLDVSAFNTSISSSLFPFIVSLPVSDHQAQTGISFRHLQDAFNDMFRNDTDKYEAVAADQSGSFQSHVVVFSMQPAIPVSGEFNYSNANGSDPEYGSDFAIHAYYIDLSLNATRSPLGWGNITINYREATAWEIVFDLPLQSFKAEQRNGEFSETAISDPVPYKGPGCNNNQSETSYGCTLNYSSYGNQYTANSSLLSAVHSALNEKLTLHVWNGVVRFPIYISNFGSGGISSDSAAYIFSIVTNQLNDSAITDHPHAGDDNIRGDGSGLGAISNITIEDVMGDIARSMTLWVRTTQGQQAIGHTYENMTFFKVNGSGLVVQLY